MATKFLLALFLSHFVSASIGLRIPLLSEQQQCRFERLSASQPSRTIQSEGGVTEFWDEKDDQFQCAGIAATKLTVRPNAISLPSYHPTPRLVYIERGQGLVGIIFPGCPETYLSQESESVQGGQGWKKGDRHQKVHRIYAGDVIAIPSGAVHWSLNDGNEELVAITFNDLNHQANQLDQKFRTFYLAGGIPMQQGQQATEPSLSFQHVFGELDESLVAESYRMPIELARKLKSQKARQRGLIVNLQGRVSITSPDGEQRQEQTGPEQTNPGQGPGANGLEENICTMKFRYNIDNRQEADIYSREAGKLNVVDKNKLPILRYLDMSAERGRLQPNALFSPQWAMQSHTVVYATSGDAQIQAADNSGNRVMDARVNAGDMFVVPQFYLSTLQAGNNGFEWVAIKTTGMPMRSTVVGYTSVMRAMPEQVLTNAYLISPNEAQQLKRNRGAQTLLLSPN